ncbi:hypothetical protein CcaCcLH18_12504 [Colletotrichum camelliae]|nr:hypothetical protein CcaCcLH18_12504 [Colletotrichum camelliae]
MAEHSQRWMQLHNATLGNLPLKHITLTCSHDAGTSYVHNNLRTELGLDDMVLTQTRSILDQLNLGVRYLDIRPVLTSKSGTQDDPSWYCGHYTNVGDAIGVQGASCVPIQKVVDDINTFTRNNPELLVIHIKRTQRIHISPATPSNPLGGESTEREPTYREWEGFFGLLNQLENLYTVESPGASKHEYLHNLPLKHFIGNGKPAVIALIEGYKNSPHIYKRGFWPHERLVTKDPDPFTRLTKGPEEDDLNFSSSLNSMGSSYLSGFSELEIAEQTQKKRFPWVLQRLERSVNRIDMDKIETTDLLTVSLADSLQEYNDVHGINNTIVVYGGKQITNQTVLGAVQKTIEQGKPFHVSDKSLGVVMDNRKGKSAAVFYRHQGLLKARWAPESQALHFDTDITEAHCKNHDVMSQSFYRALLPKIVNSRKWKFSKDLLNADEKAFGPCNSIHIRFRIAGGELHGVKAKEGDVIDFAKFGPDNI